MPAVAASPDGTTMPHDVTNTRPKFHFALPTVEDYEPYIGAKSVARIMAKAERLRDFHVVNVNSTYYGGGVAEMLSPLTLLMNAAGIKTGWRTVQGRPDFFSVTKKIHNALQGGRINLTDQKKCIFEEVAYENAQRLHLGHDVVVQKSLREGFGLTFTEAMWKGRPVVGGNAGGIRHQIEDGVTGFLVSSVRQAADRIVQLLRDPELGRRLGEKARE